MSLYLTLPLVGGIISLGLACLLLKGARRSKVHRTGFGFLFFIALYGFAVFGMRNSPDLVHALTWERLLLVATSALSVFLYHFSFNFSRIEPRRWVIQTIYLFLVVFIILTYTGLVVSGMDTDVYGYVPIPGPFFLLTVSGSYFFIILAVVNLVKGYKASQIYEERNRYLYIAIGISAMIFGALFDIVSIFGVSIQPGGGSIGNIVFCTFTAVAILRYHLWDIRIVFRKGAVYLLMSTIVAVLYVSIILLFNHPFGIGTIPFWAYAILLLLMAFALQILWRGGQRFVDRWFYRGRYDFLRELEHFSQESHDISDLEQLSFSLVKLISRALQTASVHLLLLSESGDFTVTPSTGESNAQLTLKSYNPLLRWLQFNKSLLYYRNLDIIPQLQSLTERDKKELKKIQPELLIPILTKGDELVGVLILGKKLSKQPYSKEDERLVLVVTSRMAIELENAQLYAIERSMRQELQRQDEQKTEFLHSIAHELKTPLTAIISSSELLGMKLSSASPSRRQRLIRNISRSAWLMDKRVTELLDLAKIQIGDLEPKLEPLKIGVIIKEATSQLTPLFKNKEQSLKIEILDSLPQVRADREKIEQVLLNLLSNANKFSPTGSVITLRAREAGDSIVVEVEDSAPVITEKEKGKLFDPYYRGRDVDERQRIPGLGLGLTISKKLVELHQGKIWVESEQGKGNTFIFSLPTWNKEQRGLGNSFPVPSK